MNDLLAKIKHYIGEFELEISGSTDKEIKFSFGFKGSNPCGFWLDKDYSIYKNPAERFRQDIENKFSFIAGKINEHIASRLDMASQSPMMMINGYTDEEIHNVEAIEIITDKGKRVRVFTKFKFPENK